MCPGITHQLITAARSAYDRSGIVAWTVQSIEDVKLKSDVIFFLEVSYLLKSNLSLNEPSWKVYTQLHACSSATLTMNRSTHCFLSDYTLFI